LVGLPKWIRTIPRTQPLDPATGNGWKISDSVFSKSDRSKPIKGLVVIAKAHKAPAGLPRPWPSAALELGGHRIRGINYELWHDNPDGSSVRGWHEHIWSPVDQDACVIPARPEPKDMSLIGLFRWGLSKWNIEVLEEQPHLYDDLD
jgi:hypothetical protein